MDEFDKPKKATKGPASRVCYVCGRPYGVNSYEIHLKQCKQLWVARENTKPPGERKPLPEDPILTLTLGGSGGGRDSRTPGHSGSGRGAKGGAGADATHGLSLDEMNRLAGDAFNNGGYS